MIGQESIIPTDSSFYQVTILRPNQYIRGFRGLTYLEEISESEGEAILIETKYYSIIVSPHQLLTTPEGLKQAKSLIAGSYIHTDHDAYDRVINHQIVDNQPLYELKTADGFFRANGFYLKNA